MDGWVDRGVIGEFMGGWVDGCWIDYMMAG